MKIEFGNKQLEADIQQMKTKLNEIHYAEILRDCSSSSEWLKKRDFTLTQGAANYSFIYILFKTIDEIRPKNILEFGLGQTTKVTSQYANYYSESHLDVVEHSLEWIDIHKKNLNLTPNINIHQKNLINFVLNNIESDKYDNLENVVENKKYDLIIIDGPFGFNRTYPRTNILDIIPKNLNDDFVIILDDAERTGEINTANLIFEKLNSFGINHKIFYREGLKRQLIITGLKYDYLSWF